MALGENTMTKVAAALVALLPLTAGAQENDLFLQYDGTVRDVQGCVTCVSVKPGDAYHGVLRIRTSIAGLDPTRSRGDRDPNPSVGEYGNWPNWEEASHWDFVTGFNPFEGIAQDAIIVRDERGPFQQAGAIFDSYDVRDAKDFGTHHFAAAVVGMQTTRNVIFGDGVEQAFDVEPVGNERFSGAIFRSIGKWATEIHLDVTRVTLTPGSCRP
jgi:hypothetical protein